MSSRADAELAARLLTSIVAQHRSNKGATSEADLRLGRSESFADIARALALLVTCGLMEPLAPAPGPNSRYRGSVYEPTGTALELVLGNDGNEFFAIEAYILQALKGVDKPKSGPQPRNSKNSNKAVSVSELSKILQEYRSADDHSTESHNKIPLPIKKEVFDTLLAVVDAAILVEQRGTPGNARPFLKGVAETLREIQHVLDELNKTIAAGTETAKKVAFVSASIGAAVAGIYKIFSN